jgi:hypothetical protein
MAKVGRLILEWDACQIAQDQARNLVASGECADEDAAFEAACGDEDLYGMAWRDLCARLTDVMRRKNPDGGWHAAVNNFGWRRLNGHKDFRADTGTKLLAALLPATECAFKVYHYGRGLAINNAHHDSPTWDEWYFVTPCKNIAC